MKVLRDKLTTARMVASGVGIGGIIATVTNPGLLHSIITMAAASWSQLV